MELYNAFDAAMAMTTITEMLGFSELMNQPEHPRVQAEINMREGINIWYFYLYSTACKEINTITPKINSAKWTNYKKDITYYTSDAFDATSPIYNQEPGYVDEATSGKTIYNQK